MSPHKKNILYYNIFHNTHFINLFMRPHKEVINIKNKINYVYIFYATLQILSTTYFFEIEYGEHEIFLLSHKLFMNSLRKKVIIL